MTDLSTLTRRLVSGEDVAYRMFYDAYFDRLYRYLLVVTKGDEAATRDAIQETFRRVVRHIRVFSDEAVFWSWLTVLARCARSDEGRKRRRYLGVLERFSRFLTVDQAQENKVRDGQSLEDILPGSLAGLPTGERVLLELKYFEHRSVQEIAFKLQTTEKAVESRLVRARQKLRDAILEELKS